MPALVENVNKVSHRDRHRGQRRKVLSVQSRMNHRGPSLQSELNIISCAYALQRFGKPPNACAIAIDKLSFAEVSGIDDFESVGVNHRNFVSIDSIYCNAGMVKVAYVFLDYSHALQLDRVTNKVRTRMALKTHAMVATAPAVAITPPPTQASAAPGISSSRNPPSGLISKSLCFVDFPNS